MQNSLQISRKVDYALRAMIYLASISAEHVAPFREIAQRMDTPEDFLAKILKTLADKGLVQSTRGAHGGYQLAKAARDISFLDVIEAVEGPITINLCLDSTEGCKLSPSCTMYSVWKQGQERMLEVYRAATLDSLAFKVPEAPRRQSSVGALAVALPVVQG
jgi:Rrf2 family protein